MTRQRPNSFLLVTSVSRALSPLINIASQLDCCFLPLPLNYHSPTTPIKPRQDWKWTLTQRKSSSLVATALFSAPLSAVPSSVVCLAEPRDHPWECQRSRINGREGRGSRWRGLVRARFRVVVAGRSQLRRRRRRRMKEI